MSAYSDLNRFSKEDKDMSHQKQVKQYSERDASELDDTGGYHIRHVCAMTREKLHEKSDIAAELAFRDMRIDALTKQRYDLLYAIDIVLNGSPMDLDAVNRNDDGMLSPWVNESWISGWVKILSHAAEKAKGGAA